MSTHALIARPTERGNPARWEGIYVHGDGYPRHTGAALLGQITLHFKGDLDAALAYYLDQHPTGWRHLSGDAGVGGNECYCHDAGEGEQSGWIVDQDKAGTYDWQYIIRADGMEISRFGKGSVTVPWNQERVDWQEIEQRLRNW